MTSADPSDPSQPFERHSGVVGAPREALSHPEPVDLWLDRLIAGAGLSAVFQPIVNLLTGDLVGHEVLGRFPADAPEAIAHGAADPPSLLDLAHTRGRLLGLDRAWRRLGIEAAVRGVASGEGLFFLNVDPRVIDEPTRAAGYTRGLVDRLGLSPARFVLELTEAGAALDTDRVARFVDHYASQGFRIALDDVGAGYASLTALIRLRPHFVKLDKALVSGLSGDLLRRSLVRSLADFGRRSGLRVIAEGIETDRDLAALLEAGVEIGQGYLLGRPGREAVPAAPASREIVRATASRVERAEVKPVRTVSVGALAVLEPTVRPEVSCADADRLLRQRQGRRGFPVVTPEGMVLGLLTRDRLLAETSGRFGFALHARRPITEVMDRSALRVDVNASVQHVSRLVTARDEDRIYDPVVVERDGRYAGVVPVHALLTATTEIEIEQARYASPLVGLPGVIEAGDGGRGGAGDDRGGA